MTTIRKELNRRGVYKYFWTYFTHLNDSMIKHMIKQSTNNLYLPNSMITPSLRFNKGSENCNIVTLDATEEAKKLKL